MKKWVLTPSQPWRFYQGERARERVWVGGGRECMNVRVCMRACARARECVCMCVCTDHSLCRTAASAG